MNATGLPSSTTREPTGFILRPAILAAAVLSFEAPLSPMEFVAYIRYVYSEFGSSPTCEYLEPDKPLATTEKSEAPLFLASMVYPVTFKFPSSADCLHVTSICVSETGSACTFIGGLGTPILTSSTTSGSITPVWYESSRAVILTGSDGGVATDPIIAIT